MTHVYTVDRKTWETNTGWVKLSPYWRLRCGCGWRGRRIENPGREESRDRMREWDEHKEDLRREDQ